MNLKTTIQTKVISFVRSYKNLRQAVLLGAAFTRLNLAVWLVALASFPAAAGTATWGGLGADANWATGANWSGGSGASGAAAAGDTLSFAGTTRTTTTNNMTADTSFAGIIFTNTTAGQTFTLRGNRITLGGNLVSAAAGGAIADSCSIPMILNGDRTNTLNTSHNQTLSGILSDDGGTRALFKDGAGTLTLSGNNSFGGNFTILGGQVNVTNFTASGSSSPVGAGSAITLATYNSSYQAYLNYTGTGSGSMTNSRTLALNISTATAWIQNNGSGPLVFNGPFVNTSSAASPGLNLAGSYAGANDFQCCITDTPASTLTVQVWNGANWTLSCPTNAYRNITKVSWGTLNVSTIANSGVACSMGTALQFQLGNGANSGIFNYTGAGNTNDRVAYVGGGSATGGGVIQNNGSGPLVFTASPFIVAVAATVTSPLTLGGNYTGAANQIQGIIRDNSATGPIRLTKADAGTWILSGANTYSGGTTNSAGTLVVNNNSALGTGLLTMSGGALSNSVSSALTNVVNLSVNSTIGVASASTLTIGGVITNTGALTVTGPGTLVLTNANTYTGAITISGGTLTIGGAGLLGANYAASITNNGALNYASSAAQTNSGVISGTGSLTNAGPGTLTLSGTNTYVGPTIVSAGELVSVTGSSCSNSAVTVTSGATNGVQLATAGGMWYCGALTNNSGSAVDFNFNSQTPSTTTAPLQVLNNLALTNATVIVRSLSGSLAVGQYPLIKYAGTFSGTIAGSTLALPGVSYATAGSQAYLLNNTANSSIDLLVTTATNLNWAVGSGNWDNATANWAHGGASGFYYGDGIAVILDDTATGSSPILVTNAVTVSPLSVTANLTNKNYTISGSPIAGSATLIKAGLGTLTLSASNSYGGGTVVNGGTLEVDATNALGSGLLTMSGGALSNNVSSTLTNVINLNSSGTVGVNSGQTLTLGGVITNSGALTKTGAGTLTLANTNAYAGATTVSNGILTIATTGGICYGSSSGNITISSGATLSFSGGFSYGCRAIYHNSPGTSAFIINGGTLQHTGNSNAKDAGDTGAGHLFTMGALGAAIESATAGQEFSIGYRYDFSTAIASTLGGALTLTGIGNGDFNYGIPGTGGLVKNGTGTWKLTGTNTYNGNTFINAGTLALSGGGLITNTPSITVASNAIFDVSGLTTTKPFTLAQSLSSQTLSNSAPGAIINGTNNCSTGTISLVYDGVNPSFTITNGGMTLSSSTAFKVNNTGTQLAASTSYKLIAKDTAGTAGLVAGAVTTSPITVGGNGAAATATLSITGGELWLNVASSSVATTTTVASSGSSTYGQSVTFTATIAPASGAVVPTGSVQFKTNGAALGSPVTVSTGASPNGTASISTANLPVTGSPHTVTAEYTATGSFTGSTGTLSGGQTVNPASLTITANNDSKVYGQTKTYGTGSTNFTSSGLQNSETIGTVTITATGSPTNGTVATDNVGNYVLTPSAATGGSFNPANYNITYNPGTLSVIQAVTFVGATSTNNPSGYKDAVAYIATLPSDATGSVVFSSTNGAFSTNAVSSGSATSLSITNLPRGTNVITVTYLGDGNYLGSSTNVEQIVTNHPPMLAPLSLTRTAGLGLHFPWSQLTNQWSDVDGDAVALTTFNLSTTNSVSLITNATLIGYPSTAPNVADQINYTASDSYGETVAGVINITVNAYVTGTNSIVNITTGNPTTLKAYGIIGFSYITERSTNLTDWASIATNTVSTNGVISVSDSFSDLGGNPPSSAYYRIKWQP